MYLKSIELAGFKSFADKTFLTFEPGITSVVGPNGSGKSNISDAIRWVMGEMSAKALRGGAMQDVIFAGTQKRKPLGYAQVTLTLDNSDGGFKIDYHEVAITRRVYRSGESEYYINNSPCRLKDIHELLMDTGLGRDGYSIIGQGKVNEIISGKADDRRNIFDEAAGISKFRHRKIEAQRKLTSTTDNLVRINDIVTELASRLEPLRRQSEKAKKYLTLYEEFKTLDINIFLDFADKYNDAKSALQKDFSIVCANIDTVNKNIEATIEKAKELASLEEKISSELDGKRELNSQTELMIKSIGGEIDVLYNTISSGGKMIERIEKEIGSLKLKIESYASKNTEFAQKLEEEKQLLVQMKEELKSVNDTLSSMNIDISDLTSKISAKKADIIDLLNEATDSKSKLSSLEAFKRSFIERRDAINENRRDAAEEIKKLSDKKEELKRDLDIQSSELDKMKNTAVQKREATEKLRRDYSSFTELMTNKTMEFNRHNSRLNMLREMERDFEGLGKSTKSVLTAVQNGQLQGCKIYGILSSVIDTNKKYVTAIEAALGGALGNIITETEYDAKTAINYLKRTGGGRVTFLPVSSVKGYELDNADTIAKETGFVALASRIISTDKKYAGIIKSLLGRTVIAEDMDSAIAISRKFSYRFKVVTLEGEILNAGGSVTGGSMNKTTGLLSRANDIKTLSKLTDDLKAEISDLTKKREETQKAISASEQEYEKTEAILAEKQQTVVRLNSDYSHIDILIDSAKNSDGGAEAELAQIEENIKSANEELAILINETTSQEFKVDKLKKEIEEDEEVLEELNQKRDSFASASKEKTVNLHVKERDIESVKEEISRLVQFKEEDLKSISEKERDISDIKQKNEDIKLEIEQKKSDATQASAKIEEITKAIAELEEKRVETRRLINTVNEEERQTREKLYLLKEEQSRLDAKREKLDSDMDSASAKMWDDYEITYNTALEYKKADFVLSDAKKRVSELKSSIKQLGNVNLDSVEEYKEAYERHTFLSVQAEDLTQAKNELEHLIEQITVQMKQQFTEQFALINEKFSETFTQLFGGGRASLKLSDPTDVLESGIDIEAQPPGKSLKNLSLLSGGEMAFTAIALLFAILKVRPTPFCVLDEIEAALDEPNVYRFADYLKIYCKNTQFILVTHRRGTMEAANLLYGVTMQEKGVSKLLALKIDEVEAFEN